MADTTTLNAPVIASNKALSLNEKSAAIANLQFVERNIVGIAITGVNQSSRQPYKVRCDACRSNPWSESIKGEKTQMTGEQMECAINLLTARHRDESSRLSDLVEVTRRLTKASENLLELAKMHENRLARIEAVES